MTAKLILKNQEWEVEAGKSVKQTLEELGIAWQTVLITREGILIVGEEVLQEGEIIKLVPAVSGGASLRDKARTSRDQNWGSWK